MPLYTYVVSYQGKAHVSQSRRSNHQGFGDWVADLPRGFLTESQKKKLYVKCMLDLKPYQIAFMRGGKNFL